MYELAVGVIMFFFHLEQRKLNITRSESSLMFTHSQPRTLYICKSNGSAPPFNLSRRGYTLTDLKPDTIYKVDCVAYSDGVDLCLEVNISAKTCKKHNMYSNTHTSTLCMVMKTKHSSKLELVTKPTHAQVGYVHIEL